MNTSALSCLLLMVFLVEKLNNNNGVLGASIEKRSTRLCGGDLAEALNAVCDGKFYEGPTKRSFESRPDFKYDSGDEESKEDFGLSSIGLSSILKRNIDSSRGALVRQTRGVHHECCLQSCDMDTLMSYCASPSQSNSNAVRYGRK